MPTINGDHGAGDLRNKAKGVAKMEHLRLFSEAILDCKNDPQNEKSWQKVHQEFQVLSKISNVRSLGDKQMLMDFRWLVCCGFPEKSLLWNTTGLLTKICASDPSVVPFLRDSLRFPANLTKILLSEKGSNSKTGKVLDLLGHICFGIEILKEETFLHDLLEILLSLMMTTNDEKILGQSLIVLTSLCRGNYTVVKIILEKLTDQERKTMFLRKVEDPVLQVLLNSFQYSLNKTSLVHQNSQMEDIGSYMNRLWDAVCTAYGDGNCLLLQIFNQFLADLSQEEDNKKALKTCITLTLLQQIFVAVDYSEGCNHLATSLVLQFTRKAVDFYDGDLLSLLELSVRAANFHMDGVQQMIHSVDALMLLHDVIEMIETRATNSSDSQRQSMRLHVDQIFPPLSEILTISEKKLKDKILSLDDGQNFAGVYMQVMKITNSMCGIFDWKDLVISRLSQVKTLNVFNATMKNFKASIQGFCSVPMSIQMLNLCFNLEWEDQSEELLGQNSVFVEGLHNCPNHSNEIVYFVMKNSSIKGDKWQALVDILKENDVNSSHYIHDKLDGVTTIVGDSEPKSFSNPEDYERVEVMLDNISIAAEKMTIHENLSDILELGNFRLTSQQQMMTSLKSSLRVADERIAQANILNIQLETERDKLSSVVKKLAKKVESTERELGDIKFQHKNFEFENSNSLQKANEEIEEKTAQIENLTNNCSKLQAKNVRFRDQLEALQSTIVEHQKTQEELKERLKVESKNNADLTVALAKRDEKMKKKDRMLDEERADKEKAEKELERMKKQILELEALCKSQKQAIAKKTQQLADQSEELEECRRVQEQIFNLSKFRNKS